MSLSSSNQKLALDGPQEGTIMETTNQKSASHSPNQKEAVQQGGVASESLSRENSKSSQKSVKSNSESAHPSNVNSTNKKPATDNFTDLAHIVDETSKNSSVDSGTGSFQESTHSGLGSIKHLPNHTERHIIKAITHPSPVSEKMAGMKKRTQSAKKFDTRSPSHITGSKDMGSRSDSGSRSAGSASVTAIQLTPLDESKV